MTDGGLSSIPANPEESHRLAEVADDITRRLLAGEVFDVDAYFVQHADCAERILELLPMMHDLVELGRMRSLLSKVGPRADQAHSLTRKDPLP